MKKKLKIIFFVGIILVLLGTISVISINFYVISFAKDYIIEAIAVSSDVTNRRVDYECI